MKCIKCFLIGSLMETLPVELGPGSKIMDFLYTLGVCAVLMFFCSFGRRIADSNIYTFFAHFAGCVAGYLFYMALKHLLPGLYDDLVNMGTAW